MGILKKTGLYDGAGSEAENGFGKKKGGGGEQQLYDKADGEYFLYQQRLTSNKKSDIINNMKEISIEIDKFTDCLRHRNSGEIFDTEIKKIKIRNLTLKGWKFDWNDEENKGNSIYALFIKGSDEVEGLLSTRVDTRSSAVFVSLVESAPKNFGKNGEYEGVGAHLFAEAIKQSVNNGFDGFIYFIAKTNLIEYYKEKLGAKVAIRNTMFIEADAAKQLYNKYYGGEDNDDNK